MSVISHSPTPVTQPVTPEVDLAAAKREYAFIRRLLVAALWVGSALALSLNSVVPEDTRWNVHENLGSQLLAVTHDRLGTSGLLVGKCLLGLGLLAITARGALRQGVRLLTMSVLVLLVANNLAPFFAVGPQLLSFLGMTLMLALLEQAFAGWQGALHGEEVSGAPYWAPRRLWWMLWLLPLFVLWANSHGGFAAGLAILGGYLVGRMIETVVVHRQNGLRVVALMGGLGLSAALASIANPYGYQLRTWILQAFGEPRPEIAEWGALSVSGPVFWPFVTLLLVALLAFTYTRQRRDWVQIVVLAIVAWQACLHLRYVPLVALLCGFWLPCHVQSMLQRVRPQMAAGLPVVRVGSWARWGLAALLALALGLQTWALVGRLSQIPVRSHKSTPDAVQLMHKRQLADELAVESNRSHNCPTCLAPIQVSLDGRYGTCCPQQVVDMNLDTQWGEHQGKPPRHPNAANVDSSRVLSHESPDLVLVDLSFSQPVEAMQYAVQQNPGEWTLLYQDAVAQLWDSSQRHGDPASTHYLPSEARRVGDERITSSLPRPAFPSDPPATPLAERVEVAPPADSL